jgi:hypothetical protein
MVVLKDGDDIAVMAQMNELSAFDPMGEYGSVMRCYRVVAVKNSDPVFELIPLTEPTLVSSRDTERGKELEK